MAGLFDVQPLLRYGAMASVGAGFIHLLAARSHGEHPMSLGAFLLLAALQVAAAAAVVVVGGRIGTVSLVSVNVIAVAGWVVTKTVGVPWIEGLDVAEAPHLADMSAAVLAVSAVALGALAGREVVFGVRLASLLVVALLAATGLGLADASSHHHAHDEHSVFGDLVAVEETDRPLPQSEIDAIVRLGQTDAGPPPNHDHADEYVAIGVAEEDRAGLAIDVAAAASAVTDLDTVEKASALGYVLATAPSPGIGTHWVHWSRILQPFDVRRPSMLLFDHSTVPARLVGYSYAIQSASEPAGFTGDSDVWHRHRGLCVALSGWVVRERSRGTEDCSGSFIAGGDFWMLHAWVVPGWENRDGMFAPMNPILCPPKAGTPDYLRCPD